jgi:hypothetical protein
MTKKSNHQTDIKNANKGTKGSNTTYDKNQGNRGKQLNPNQKGKRKLEITEVGYSHLFIMHRFPAS